MSWIFDLDLDFDRHKAQDKGHTSTSHDIMNLSLVMCYDVYDFMSPDLVFE